VIDKVYRLDEVPEAMRHLGGERALGKIVIRVKP
jgi:NADPH:quinone reductase-like Zn-dependent oxidoreductase